MASNIKFDIEFYKKNGYAVIEDYLSLDEVEQLKTECRCLVGNMNPDENRGGTATGDLPQNTNDYLMKSADKIRFFFEKEAFNDKGQIQLEKLKCLNKIGHALHWLNPVFKKVTFNESTKSVARALGFTKPSVIQSMYIFKLPGIGAEFYPHQDATYLYGEPLSMVGIWTALEDATVSNGCLEFIPGSHSEAVTKRMVRNPDPNADEGSTLFRGSDREYKNEEFVPIPVKKGSAILIHGQVVHRSGKNSTDSAREVYTFHVFDNPEDNWSKENWLQPTDTYAFPRLYDN